jgi:hypothetical protein
MDWVNLFANALWILGCAVALATLSYAGWHASTSGTKFSIIFNNPRIQIVLHLSGVLFCFGWAALSSPIIIKILWVILGGLFAFLGFINRPTVKP